MEEIELDYMCVECARTVIMRVRREKMRLPRATCPDCGCFMYPVEKIPAPPPTKDVYEEFAACPCAHECHQLGIYAADCEQGRVMPKCFKAIHERLDIFDHYLIEPLMQKAREQTHRERRKAGKSHGS